MLTKQQQTGCGRTWPWCLPLFLAISLGACADAIPTQTRESAPDQPSRYAVVRVIGEPNAQVPTFFGHRDADHGSPPRDQISGGTTLTVYGRDDSGKWLFFVWGWIASHHVDVIEGILSKLPVALTDGLWVIPITLEQPAMQLAAVSHWNTWQWDPAAPAIWFHRYSGGVSDYWDRDIIHEYDRVSRWVLSGERTGRIDYHLRGGTLLAAPLGAAVLVRAWNRSIWPLGDLYILEADGTTYQVGTQCAATFTDSYVPFGTSAAWSPDGQYVVLKDTTILDSGACYLDHKTIIGRNGFVAPDLTDPHDPYRQAWYREPDFRDQVGRRDPCDDAPPGVQLYEQHDNCLWSPDQRWFATVPGNAPHPHLAELLIYTADGALTKRFLVAGWPCNTFQWSPDSNWLAYGGPSGCA